MTTLSEKTADRQELPYRRIDGPPNFSKNPRLLNLQAMRAMWRTYIDLVAEPSTHVIARSPWVTWTYTLDRPEGELLSRPWTSLLPAGGLRLWVLDQLRVPNALSGDDQDYPQMRRLVELHQRWLSGSEGTLRQLQMSSILGSLSISVPVLNSRVPDPLDTNPVNQHLRYVHSCVVHQRYARDEQNNAVMDDLAINGSEPAIRMLGTIRVISQAIRVDHDLAQAPPWIEHGQQVLPQLGEHPGWLYALLQSRFHRVEALYLYRLKDLDGVQAALSKSFAADQLLHDSTNGDPILEHYWLENHRTLLESQVKGQIGRSPSGIEPVLYELDQIEPYFPESRFFIGQLYYRDGQTDRAAEHFLNAARGGGGRASAAAFRAFECYRELDDLDSARNCLLMAQELDPLIDFNDYAADVGLSGSQRSSAEMS